MTLVTSTLSLLLLHLLSSDYGTNPGFLVNAAPLLSGNITHIVGRTARTNVWDSSSSSSSSKHSTNEQSLQVSSLSDTISIILPPTDQFSNGRIQQHFLTIPPVRGTISIDSVSDQSLSATMTSFIPFEAVPLSLPDTITVMTTEGTQKIPNLIDTEEIFTTILPSSEVLSGDKKKEEIVSSTPIDTFIGTYSQSSIEPDYPVQTLTVEIPSPSKEYTLSTLLSRSEYLMSTPDVSQVHTMGKETSSYTYLTPQSMVTVPESVNSSGSASDTTQTELPATVTTITMTSSKSFYSSQLVPTSSPQTEVLSSTALQSSHSSSSSSFSSYSTQDDKPSSSYVTMTLTSILNTPASSPSQGATSLPSEHVFISQITSSTSEVVFTSSQLGSATDSYETSTALTSEQSSSSSTGTISTTTSFTSRYDHHSENHDIIITTTVRTSIHLTHSTVTPNQPVSPSSTSAVMGTADITLPSAITATGSFPPSSASSSSSSPPPFVEPSLVSLSSSDYTTSPMGAPISTGMSDSETEPVGSSTELVSPASSAAIVTGTSTVPVPVSISVSASASTSLSTPISSPSSVILTSFDVSTTDSEYSSLTSYPTTSYEESAPTSISTQTQTETSSVTSLSNLPRAILGPNKIKYTKGYTLITIGFKQSLNYPLVVKTPQLSANIFASLPQILDAPFGDAYEGIEVLQLVPLNGAGLFGYTATVAEVYFPIAEIETLSQLIKNQSSELYENDNVGDIDLALLINPEIPITGLVPSDILNSGESSEGGQSVQTTDTSGSGNTVMTTTGSGSAQMSSTYGVTSSTKGQTNEPKNDSYSLQSDGNQEDSPNDSVGTTESHHSKPDSETEARNLRYEDFGTLGYSVRPETFHDSNTGHSFKRNTVGIVLGVVLGSIFYALGIGYLIKLRRERKRRMNLSDDMFILDGDDDFSLFSSPYLSSSDSSTFSERNDNEDVVLEKINSWRSLSSSKSEIRAQTNSPKVARWNISAPIACKNSLGWNEV